MARIGHYYRFEEIGRVAPDVLLKWYGWLDAQRDPGLYDAYKVKDPKVLPYIDGHPQWVCDVYMPPEIEDKLPDSIRKSNVGH